MSARFSEPSLLAVPQHFATGSNLAGQSVLSFSCVSEIRGHFGGVLGLGIGWRSANCSLVLRTESSRGAGRLRVQAKLRWSSVLLRSASRRSAATLAAWLDLASVGDLPIVAWFSEPSLLALQEDFATEANSTRRAYGVSPRTRRSAATVGDRRAVAALLRKCSSGGLGLATAAHTTLECSHAA